MTEGNFTDWVKIYVNSGHGGKGSTHLRREKFISKGGPDGGDGGRGGHIIVRGNKQLWTLFHFKFNKYFKARHGGDGGKSRSTGANGSDVYVQVPLGTIVRTAENEKPLVEIVEDCQEFIISKGGVGGRGNWHFRSSVNQTPRYAQPGLSGEEKTLILELKALADVGLVGFPNAGKSTLLSVMSSAKPKIADYEFTTLKPNLGIVACRSFKSFVMADIPGIIEGASKGKGLGYRFLRHIERNALLLFLVSADSNNVVSDYGTLVNELRLYNPKLLNKDRVLVISKSDLLDEELEKEIQGSIENNVKDVPYIFVSSISQKGITLLKDLTWELLDSRN